MPSIPQLQVESVRKIFNDGAHNAFTDLCRFQGVFYVTFRSSMIGHDISPGSQIVVLQSDDGERWTPAFRFTVPQRDVRDPHFVIHRDRLWVLSSTWLCDGRKDMGDHQGFGACTSDGKNWTGPIQLQGTHGWYIWRTATCNDRAYMIGRVRREIARHENKAPTVDARTVLLQCDDCVHWSQVSVIADNIGNETAILFEPDGELLALIRASGTHSELRRARPPYEQWSRTVIDRFIGGPLLAAWDGRILVGGRKHLTPDAADKSPRMVLSWLIEDQLHDVLELPSGGDTSYPGFVATGPDTGMLSYYSSHEGSGNKQPPSAIYLAHLRISK